MRAYKEDNGDDQQQQQQPSTSRQLPPQHVHLQPPTQHLISKPIASSTTIKSNAGGGHPAPPPRLLSNVVGINDHQQRLHPTVDGKCWVGNVPTDTGKCTIRFLSPARGGTALARGGGSSLSWVGEVWCGLYLRLFPYPPHSTAAQ
jgi:hypothetical protein